MEDLSPKQVWLLNYKNPLTDRFGKEFFKNIPENPGVYWMLGNQGEVLYIGKAKNLKNRLKSYQRAKPDQVSRKVLRLVYLLSEIRWEQVSSEKEALLRENALLREHRPPFNVMNTSPESYLFLGFAQTSTGFYLSLSNPSWKKRSWPPVQEVFWKENGGGISEGKELELYGAFKGRGMIQSGYAALLRLLWLVFSYQSAERFEFPSILMRRRVPDHYQIDFREGVDPKTGVQISRLIRRFLKGTSIKLLERLSQVLLEVQDIPPFFYSSIQADLEFLKEFFQYGPARNRKLRRFHQFGQASGEHLIPQNEIDDLLVTYRIGEKLDF